MGFGLGGKKTDNSVILSKGYAKGGERKARPFRMPYGLAPFFSSGDSILETVWLNLLTRDIIADAKQWEEGLGTAPWEKMPEGEFCLRAGFESQPHGAACPHSPVSVCCEKTASTTPKASFTLTIRNG